MQGFILAAGRGSRLRPLTDTTPKPLVRVQGHALIDWRLEAMAAAGIDDVVINLAWLGDAIRAHVGDGERYGLRVRYSDEGSAALETGGGFARALSVLGTSEPVLVTNADVWTDYPLRHLVQRAWPADALAHLVLVPPPTEEGAGDFGLDGDRVCDTPRQWTFSGVSVLHPALVADVDASAFPLAPCLHAAAARHQVSGEVYHGIWSDVGTPERLAAVNAPPESLA